MARSSSRRQPQLVGSPGAGPGPSPGAGPRSRRACPPGVWCLQGSSTSGFLVLLLVLLAGYLLLLLARGDASSSPAAGPGSPAAPSSAPVTIIQQQLGGADALGFAADPPLRDERLWPFAAWPFVSSGVSLGVGARQGAAALVPINVETNVGAAPLAPYRQLGILTPAGGKSSTDKILPLMGKPVLTTRDKWQYYTVSNQNNQIRLPVSRNGRSCTSEYGCDRLDTGDTVYVEGHNEVFTATLYDTATYRYLPVAL